MGWYYSKLELPSLSLERMEWWPVLFAVIPFVLIMIWHLGWRKRAIRSLLKGSGRTSRRRIQRVSPDLEICIAPVELGCTSGCVA